MECWALKACCARLANLIVDFGSEEQTFGYFNEKDYLKPKSGRGRMCKFLGNAQEITQRESLLGKNMAGC